MSLSDEKARLIVWFWPLSRKRLMRRFAMTSPLSTSDTLPLSIAAGKTIATLETAFDAALPVIRTDAQHARRHWLRHDRPVRQ